MAVSKRGSMDEAVFKMLYVHIPSLHPANYPDLEVSSGVQTAAVMGIGLLYQGSKNRRMAEMLLSGPSVPPSLTYPHVRSRMRTYAEVVSEIGRPNVWGGGQEIGRRAPN